MEMADMRKIVFPLIVMFALMLLPQGCKKELSDVDLSPASWPEGELDKYRELNKVFNEPAPYVVAEKGMIVGTTGSLACRAGLETLMQGGSAADAAMTTAMTQICLAMGSWVSYAGIMTMVYYDAKADKVHFMFSGYNTVQGETDPQSIPKMGEASGRTALVPGFLAGVQAAHDKFGKVPFSQLFEPAIYFAENGIEVDSMHAAMLGFRKKVLSRLPETKKIFAKDDGEFYKKGDTFKQLALAQTLRNVAAQGTDYIYRGEWAQKFVDAVQADGGKMSLKDLEDYSVVWAEPLKSTYKDYEIYTLNAPSIGGVNTIEALNLMEVSTLAEKGHYTESPRALLTFIQAAALPFLMHGYYGVNPQSIYPEISSETKARVTKEHAQRIWEIVSGSDWPEVRDELINGLMKAYGEEESDKESKGNPKHSDAIVAVDQYGNVAAVCHSINCAAWGTTGIFVDGISIPDSANFQQQLIEAVGPGKPLPDPTNPLLIFKSGKPFLASSSIGSDLHSCTLQNLFNVLDFGMDPKKSVETANFHLFSSNPRRRSVTKGDFSEEIIEGVRDLGEELQVVTAQVARGFLGYWVGIRIDSETGKLEGGVSRQINGLVLGY